MGYSQALAIKEAIITVFTASQGASGTLYAVKAVGPTGYNETGVSPYVGVELIKTSESFGASHQIKIKMSFGISVSVTSTTLLQDAYKARDLIIDDGNGNGIQPLLRNSIYTLLVDTNGDPLIEKCEITDTILLSNVSESKASAPTVFYADALIVFECYQGITI